MYGILLRIGGPNSLRDSDSRFRPPIRTVPPSGTATVVCTETLFCCGCWMNWVKTIGPCWNAELPSCEVKIGKVIGKVDTSGGTLVNVGAKDSLTNLRSAEIT